ncbi:MAG: hypothetical protein ACRC5C_03445 [Bacilli bacterium]
MKEMHIGLKIAAATVATGTVVFAATAMNFDGSAHLQTVYETFTKATSELNVFKSNETKLMNKVTTLREEIANLQAQIKDLEQNGSPSQQEQIAVLQGEIARLQGELDALRSEKAALLEELLKANEEIIRANDETRALKDYVVTQEIPEANKTMDDFLK